MRNIKESLSSNYFTIFVLLIITLFGLYLRIIGIDKPGGLWTDEAYGYYIAKHSFPFGILHKLYTEDGHAPLYFFILHFWMKVFGNGDIILRSLSVIFGVLNIPVAYLAARELSSKTAGFIAASIVCVNSLLIYYSQEVKFYSFLGLLCTLSIYFVLKIRNNESKRWFWGLVITNLLISYTYSIGLLFVIIETAVFGVYIYRYKRDLLRKLINSSIILLVLFLPYLPFLTHQSQVITKSVVNPFQCLWFGYTNFIMLLQNWFSPIIAGLMNVHQGYYELILQQGLGVAFILFVIIPVVIGIGGIVKALSQKHFSLVIFSIAILLLLAEIIATVMGKFALISRYTIMSFVLIIPVVAHGLASIKNKTVLVSIISIFISVNLFYILISPESAPKQIRLEGYNTVAEVLNRYSLNKNDVVFIVHCPKLLEKYYPMNQTNIVPFDIGDVFVYNKDNALKNVFTEDIATTVNRSNAYDLLRDYIALQSPSKSYEQYFKKEVIDKVKKNGRLIIVVPVGMSLYQNSDLQKITQDYETYKKVPMFFMLNSKISNDTLQLGYTNFSPIEIVDAHSWYFHILKRG